MTNPQRKGSLGGKLYSRVEVIADKGNDYVGWYEHEAVEQDEGRTLKIFKTFPPKETKIDYSLSQPNSDAGLQSNQLPQHGVLAGELSGVHEKVVSANDVKHAPRNGTACDHVKNCPSCSIHYSLSQQHPAQGGTSGNEPVGAATESVANPCPKCGHELTFEDQTIVGGPKDYWSCLNCGEEQVMFGSSEQTATLPPAIQKLADAIDKEMPLKWCEQRLCAHRTKEGAIRCPCMCHKEVRE